MTRLMLAGFRTSHRRTLSAAARAAGHMALACDVDEVVDLLRLDARYAVLLDMTAPDGEAPAVAHEIRDAHPPMVLVGLAGIESVARRVAWLDVLDRCLPISEDPEVVLAELAALARRCSGGLSHIVQVGRVVLDADLGTVDVAGSPVRVTAAEMKMLHFLMAQAGTVVTKQAILAAFYGPREVSEKLIDVYVCKLRSKLAAAGAPSGFIKTVWGRGYMVDDVAAEPTRELAA